MDSSHEASVSSMGEASAIPTIEVDLSQGSTTPLLSAMPCSQAEAIPLESEKPMAQETQATASPHLEKELARTFAQALFMQESEVKLEKALVDMGLDSIIAVEWIRYINKQYAINFKATIVYDYPTIRQLASFLQKELSMRETAIQHTPAQPLSPLIDEVLQQVQQKNLDPHKAEQLLRRLSL